MSLKKAVALTTLIEHNNHKILVKASTGALPNQFQKLNVDVLFLGIAQLSKQSPEFQQQYLAETIDQLQPKKSFQFIGTISLNHFHNL